MKRLRRLGAKTCFRLFFGFLAASPLCALSNFGPQYRAIEDITAQKAAFVQILLPKVHAVNLEIIKERRFVKNFFTHRLFTYNVFDREDLIRMHDLAKKYRIKHLYDEKAFMRKIAPIPVSLVLAQAAVESAWGKSRFVERANNIFGEWTYGEKGLVPDERPEGMNHKIRIFKTLKASVAAYALNLNRHRAYREFREKRQHSLLQGQNFSGMDAADTMEKYSGIGEEYNELLKEVIESNRFSQYDTISAQIGLLR